MNNVLLHTLCYLQVAGLAVMPWVVILTGNPVKLGMLVVKHSIKKPAFSLTVPSRLSQDTQTTIGRERDHDDN